MIFLVVLIVAVISFFVGAWCMEQFVAPILDALKSGTNVVTQLARRAIDQAALWEARDATPDELEKAKLLTLIQLGEKDLLILADQLKPITAKLQALRKDRNGKR